MEPALPYPRARGQGHQGYLGLGRPWACLPRETLEGVLAPEMVSRAVEALNGISRVRGPGGVKSPPSPASVPGGRVIRAGLGLVRAC